MPLPDERRTQSVANLIGRFEQQTKRNSLSNANSNPPPPVPLPIQRIIVPHSSVPDSAPPSLFKREWPPKAATVTPTKEEIKPKLFEIPKHDIPKPLVLRQTSILITNTPPTPILAHPAANKPPTPVAVAPTAVQEPEPVQAVPEPQQAPAPVELIAPVKPPSPPPSNDASVAQVQEPLPASPPPPVEPRIIDDPPAPVTLIPAQVPVPAPVIRAKHTSPPAKPSLTPATNVKSKSLPSSPNMSAAGLAKSPQSSYKPLKAQLTGQSTTSNSSTVRSSVRSGARNSISTTHTPSQASRPKTPGNPLRPKTPSANMMGGSRPKTPASVPTRPKTPSTGLYAPTAASLAKSRSANNAPPVPIPNKKATLSAGATASLERLLKPTAASASKVRSPVIPQSPIVRRVSKGSTPVRSTPKVAKNEGGSRLSISKRLVSREITNGHAFLDEPEHISSDRELESYDSDFLDDTFHQDLSSRAVDALGLKPAEGSRARAPTMHQPDLHVEEPKELSPPDLHDEESKELSPPLPLTPPSQLTDAQGEDFAHLVSFLEGSGSLLASTNNSPDYNRLHHEDGSANAIKRRPLSIASIPEITGSIPDED